MLRRLVKWLQPLIFIVALFAIGWFLADQWPTLRTYPWRIHGGWLVVTYLLTVASWALEIAIWQRLLDTLGGKLPFWTAARIWFLSAIVRYIPGSIWQPLSLTLYGRRHGVTPETTLTSIILFQVLTTLSVVPIVVVYFIWIDTRSLAAQYVNQFPSEFLWVSLIPLVVFLLYPRWLIQMLNWGLARFHRPLLSMKISSWTLLALLLATLFDWLLWGCVFASFAFAVTGGIESTLLTGGAASPLTLSPLLIAAFPIASMIGFLAIVMPGGFGVREGAFFLLLSPPIVAGVVAVIALGIRVWGIANELLFAAISAPFERASMRGVDAQVQAGDLPTAIEISLREPVVAPDLRRESL